MRYKMFHILALLSVLHYTASVDQSLPEDMTVPGLQPGPVKPQSFSLGNMFGGVLQGFPGGIGSILESATKDIKLPSGSEIGKVIDDFERKIVDDIKLPSASQIEKTFGDIIVRKMSDEGSNVEAIGRKISGEVGTRVLSAVNRVIERNSTNFDPWALIYDIGQIFTDIFGPAKVVKSDFCNLFGGIFQEGLNGEGTPCGGNKNGTTSVIESEKNMEPPQENYG